jgi:hypothetical protein
MTIKMRQLPATIDLGNYNEINKNVDDNTFQIRDAFVIIAMYPDYELLLL